MTDKEKIKQEIERIIEEETPISKGSDYYHGAKESMNKLLQFIDSLPEESANEDLEEEYDNYFKKHEMDIVLNPYSNCKDLARHFAEWQKQQIVNDAFIVNYIVHDGRIELEGDPLPSVDPIILLPYPEFKPNDKVKIIIIKE